MRTWIVVLLAVNIALFTGVFGLLSRIDQRLARIEKKRMPKRSTGKD